MQPNTHLGPRNVDENGNRICSRCGGSGPFSPNSNSKDGLRSICKSCTAGSTAKYRLDAPDYGRRQWQVNLRRWKLTPAQYIALFKKQGGTCALCGKAEVTKLKSGKIRKLAVDHDHACCPASSRETCGKCIRGLLCLGCNVAIGRVEGIGLEKVLAYLERAS